MSLLKYSIVFAMYTHAQSGAQVTPPQFDLPPAAEQGMASWYGNGAWHGSVTANGEPFAPHEFTCAHRTLSFDTVVLIENQRTQTRSWCRINDRGPYGAVDAKGLWHVSVHESKELNWRGILDMSIATADKLGTRAQGLEAVHLRYWKKRPSQSIDLAIWTPRTR